MRRLVLQGYGVAAVLAHCGHSSLFTLWACSARTGELPRLAMQATCQEPVSWGLEYGIDRQMEIGTWPGAWT